MKPFLKYCTIGLFLAISSLALVLYLSEKPPLLEGIPFSKAIFDEQGHLLRLSLSPDEKYRLYIPYHQISPSFIEISLLQEDRYFYWHPGINPVALIRAAIETYFLKSRRMGASTISMQVARLRFGIQSKKPLGKLQQIYKALQIERHYSKEQILEAYLNLAPYGGNIEGIGAASLIYFNHLPQTLNLAESLNLALIPQNPNKRSSKTLAQLKTLKQQILNHWLVRHPNTVSPSPLAELPLDLRPTAKLPFYAPQFVNHVLHRMPEKQYTLDTTLDLNLQKSFERKTTQYLKRVKAFGVYNAAILLIDTRNQEVKVSIGSADFNNPKIQGQLDGTSIKRSPGSTLKPFIYALAFDQGLIHPNTVLKDVPRQFGSYNPENFDKDFMGPVKAKDALVLSRNIPAIELASHLKNPTLFQLLIDAAVSNLRPESYYGLSLSLGGADLSLQELVGLYAMLANEGLWQPLRVTKDSPYPMGKHLLSKEASFLIRDILEKTARPSGFESLNLPIAWKTGTSSGYRDAWTLGIVGHYVLGVWLGNFNNEGNPTFVGKTLAAPLFFELATQLNHEYPLSPLKTHPEFLQLKKIEVCKASGLLPTKNCPVRETTWFIPGKSPIKTDTIFREIAIDKKTGLRTCHIHADTLFKVYEFWPSDLLAIFKQAGIQRRIPPDFLPDCITKGRPGLSPHISSPNETMTYMKHKKTRIPFIAVSDADVKTLYWFINESYLGKVDSTKPFFWEATPGNFNVRVVDDHGLTASQTLKVQRLP